MKDTLCTDCKHRTRELIPGSNMFLVCSVYSLGGMIVRSKHGDCVYGKKGLSEIVEVKKGKVRVGQQKQRRNK